MRRRALFFSLLSLLVLLNGRLCLAQTRTVIAVVGFRPSGEISASGALALSNIVNNEIIESGRYTVVDRRNVESLLEEMGLQYSGATTQETIVELGRILNATKMVFGTIGQLGEKYIIEIQLIDVQTARIEKSVIRSYFGAAEGLDSPVEHITRQLIGLKGVPVSGASIYVTSNPEGAKIYVDNAFVGNAPINIPMKGLGTCTVRASTSGHDTWIQQVVVDEDETVFVHAILPELKGYRFVLKRDGPLVLGAGTAIGAIVFKMRADNYYEDQKTADDLDAWRRAKTNTDRSMDVSKVLAVISVTSFAYSLYRFLKKDKTRGPDIGSSLHFSFPDGIRAVLVKRFW